MKQLSKTKRQRREYNKYLGFLSIKKNYENLLEKSMNDSEKIGRVLTPMNMQMNIKHCLMLKW